MRNNEFKPLFDLHGETIRIYLGKETEVDPISHETEVVLFDNPIYLTAIVSDLTATQISYKIPGIETTSAKEVFIQKKYKNIILLSRKIVIDGTEYEGWKRNGTIQYRTEMNYLRIYVYSNK